ncbi:hypothetical protein AB7M26_000443 [Pseudomonas sp. F-14 TE3482]
MLRFMSLMVSMAIIASVQCARSQAEEQSCSSAWEQSAARASCKPLKTASLPETPPMAVSEPQGCRIRVICRNQFGGGSPVDYPNLDPLSVQRLHNCNGELKTDGCQ